MIKHVITFALSAFVCYSYAATIDVRLVIESGTHNLAGGNTVDVITYSASGSFEENSPILIWTQGDIVNLKVVNNHTDAHGLNADGLFNYPSIAPGDSSTQTITLANEGFFRYHDNQNEPYNSYLGLSGIIHIKQITDVTPYFYWDIREIQSEWNPILNAGGSVSLTDYEPDFFTVNGHHNPNINQDPIARVTGNVGQEFRIVMVNNGLSIHSMHFHGYHLINEADSRSPLFVGRDKDTFPLYPHEYVVLSCIPDKPGEYPVHDHNLVAVTGGQEYATGMFLTLLIAQ